MTWDWESLECSAGGEKGGVAESWDLEKREDWLRLVYDRWNAPPPSFIAMCNLSARTSRDE